MEITIRSRHGSIGVSQGLIKTVGLAGAALYTVLENSNPEGITASDLQISDPNTTPEMIREIVGPDSDGFYKVEAAYLQNALDMSPELRLETLRKLVELRLVDLKCPVHSNTLYVKCVDERAEELEIIGESLIEEEGHNDETYKEVQ
jgi:hypothetical protein